MSVKDCDSHKLMYHPQSVAKWLNNELVPLHAEVGVTNRCNHRCKFCILDWVTHGTNDLNPDIYNKCLKDMAEMGVKSVYYAGDGEQTLHPNLPEFIENGKKLGMSQALSTNGSLMKDETADKIIPNLSWIRFSLDAATPETYKKIHGVSENEYNKVLNNIKYCVSLKNTYNLPIDIGVQIIAMEETINDIEPLAIWCKENKVDNIQIKPAHNHPKSSYHTGLYNFVQQSLQEKLEKLNDDKFTVVVRVKSMERLTQEKTYRCCHGFDFYIIIDARGNIIPCSIFYNNDKYIYGNLYQNDIKTIWLSENRKNIINNITDLKFKTCKEYKCRLDVLNRYLDRIKYPEKNDEFI